jgi:hypothetical protein
LSKFQTWARHHRGKCLFLSGFLIGKMGIFGPFLSVFGAKIGFLMRNTGFKVEMAFFEAKLRFFDRKFEKKKK